MFDFSIIARLAQHITLSENKKKFLKYECGHSLMVNNIIRSKYIFVEDNKIGY